MAQQVKTLTNLWANTVIKFGSSNTDYPVFPVFYMYQKERPTQLEKFEDSSNPWTNEITIDSLETFIQTIMFDHLPIWCKDGHLLNDNFQTSNVIIQDADNGATDVQYSIYELANELHQMDVKCIIYPSKSCGKIAHKNTEEKISCHLAFPLLQMVEDREQYSKLKQAIHKQWPCLDAGVKAVAQKTFYSPADVLEAYKPFYINGSKYIDEVLEIIPEASIPPVQEDVFSSTSGEEEAFLPNYKEQSDQSREQEASKTADKLITSNRNTTLFHYACQIIYRADGNAPKVRNLFDTRAKMCKPPLDANELGKIWSSAIKSVSSYLSSQEDDRIPADVYTAGLEPEDFTDVDQARVLLTQYGKYMLFCNELGWLIWDGCRWSPSEEKAIRLEHLLTKRQLIDAKEKCKNAWESYTKIVESLGKNDAKSIQARNIAVHCDHYKDFVLSNRLQRKITNVLECARVYRMVRVEELDKDGYLLNTPSGTIDLRTGNVYPAKRSDYITKVTAASLSPVVEEKYKALQTFIKQICLDDGLANYLQIIVGMALCGEILSENLVIAYGGGRNGKSTLWNLVKYILGDYAGSIRSDLLTISKNNNNSDSQKASLRGKRLVIAAELDEDQRLNTSMLKQLCSRDSINACLKFKEPFDFIPTHTVVLYTNHLPSVGTMDDGTWRRIQHTLIPFNARFEGANENKDMEHQLKENLSSTALLWAVQGAVRYIADNGKLYPPPQVEEIGRQYRSDNDTLELFVKECCECGAGFSVKSSEIQKAWKDYCQSNGYYSGKGNTFKQRIIDYGFPSKRTSAGIIFEGLKLSQDDSYLEHLENVCFGR